MVFEMEEGELIHCMRWSCKLSNDDLMCMDVLLDCQELYYAVAGGEL